jgi:hypothetical protein
VRADRRETIAARAEPPGYVERAGLDSLNSTRQPDAQCSCAGVLIARSRIGNFGQYNSLKRPIETGETLAQRQLLGDVRRSFTSVYRARWVA